MLKEPRIGRLVPFYIDVLRSAGYDLRVILTRRDPHAVAQSFASRDDNGLGHALLLWTSYALSVERSTRGLSRTFVSYDELMLDPARVLLDAASELGIAYPRPLPGAIGEIRQHLAFEHYHNLPGQGVLPSFIADAHRALGALAAHDHSALRMLDRQRELAARLVRQRHRRQMSVAHLAGLCEATARRSWPRPDRASGLAPSAGAARPRNSSINIDRRLAVTRPFSAVALLASPRRPPGGCRSRSV